MRDRAGRSRCVTVSARSGQESVADALGHGRVLRHRCVRWPPHRSRGHWHFSHMARRRRRSPVGVPRRQEPRGGARCGCRRGRSCRCCQCRHGSRRTDRRRLRRVERGAVMGGTRPLPLATGTVGSLNVVADAECDRCGGARCGVCRRCRVSPCDCARRERICEQSQLRRSGLGMAVAKCGGDLSHLALGDATA